MASCSNFRFRLFNRCEDIWVSATATDIAAHPFADFVIAVRVTFFHTCDRGTNLARRAVAALKSVVLDERALHWMQLFAIGQTFYGRDLVAFMRDSETEAGIDAPPVH